MSLFCRLKCCKESIGLQASRHQVWGWDGKFWNVAVSGQDVDVDVDYRRARLRHRVNEPTLSSPYSTNNITQRAGSCRSEDLDSNDIRGLGDTIRSGCDGARTMCAMTIVIPVGIFGRYGAPPGRTTLEFEMGGIDAGIGDIHVDALAALGIVFVFLERTKIEFGAVTDARKALG